MVMKKILFILSLVSMVLISGCNSCNATKTAVPLPESSRPLYAPPPPPAANCAARIYPCEGCGVVRLEEYLPAQVKTGEKFEYKIKVTNLTNSALADVVVTDTLISNFGHISSSPPADIQGNKLIWVLAGLGPKETKVINAAAVANTGGIVQNCADVTYKMPLCAQSVSIRPQLAISKTAPQMQYLGKEITYEITVTNASNCPAVNTLIVDEISSGAYFVRASRGGVFTKGRVVWKIAKLNAGDTARTSVTYIPKEAGTVVNTTKALAANIDTVTAQAITQVRGVPGILLEVIDLTDKIRVGNDVTYRIMVTNQGSIAGTNIAVQAILEPEMQYVSSTGATRGTFAGDTITFAPLPSLAVQARATWEVTVKAKAVADVRFRVKMKSDQITRNVEETESTNFYE
jgi:uncharacterized repeat protein (TIGR01451 family)